MSTDEGFEEVLRFWFSSLPTGDHAAMVRQMEWWFRGGADAEIVERFPPLLDQAKRGELDSWSQRPRSRLALIIVLDQFSRTIHRGSAQAFAQDPKALGLALEGIENGHYSAPNTLGENFLFLAPRPFRRSHESGTSGQSRRGACQRRATRASRHAGVLRKSGPWPSRRHRTLRPSPSPQRSPGPAIHPGGTRVPRSRPARPYASAAMLAGG